MPSDNPDPKCGRCPHTRSEHEREKLAKSNGGALTDFAKAIGSTKGVDLIPPDQYLSYQDPRYPLRLRLWAWLLAHTIAGQERTPHAKAKGKNGKPLTLKHAAAHLDVDYTDVWREWTRMETEGRVSRGADSLLVLSGDFELPATVTDSTGKKSSGRYLSAYITKELANLDPEIRVQLVAAEETEYELRKRARNRLDAALYVIFQQRQHNIWARAGVKLRRHDQGKPEEIAERDRALQPILSFVENLTEDIEREIFRKTPENHTEDIKNLPEAENARQPQGVTAALSESFTGETSNRKTIVSQSETDRPTKAPERLALIAAAIPDALAERLHETKGLALLRQIDFELRGAPPYLLADAIAKVERTRPMKFTSLGLCIKLAGPIGQTWMKGAAERARAAAASETARQAAITHAESEQAAAARKRQQLIDHPEACEFCRGAGFYSSNQLPAELRPRIETRMLCHCPAGDAAAPKKKGATHANPA